MLSFVNYFHSESERSSRHTVFCFWRCSSSTEASAVLVLREGGGDRASEKRGVKDALAQPQQAATCQPATVTRNIRLQTRTGLETRDRPEFPAGKALEDLGSRLLVDIWHSERLWKLLNLNGIALDNAVATPGLRGPLKEVDLLLAATFGTEREALEA